MAQFDDTVPRLTTALSGPLLFLEKKMFERQADIEKWFREQWRETPPPIYGSVDLRNAGFKLAAVDTNLFPAGFNNLNPAFMPLCIQAASTTLSEICPDATNLLLIPESHSRNRFYFESLGVLYEILSRAGYVVRIGSLDPELTKPRAVRLESGNSITLEPLIRKDDRVGIKDFFPCCIILNNDLSAGIPKVLERVSQTILPSSRLGWSNRLKSQHFGYYEKVCDEFSRCIDLDSWLITPLFDQCPEVDFMNQQGQACLVERADVLLKKINKKYKEYQIDKPPFLVIKADQGTYGMAVMMIRDSKELLSLNRKQRTKMSMIKGGARVTKAMIQEGVYTFETIGDQRSVAEPVVYLIGRHVVGGFYRLHQQRGQDENLNAPGMDFKPLAFAETCYSPCTHETEHANRFYAYGVIARLALLAAARELKTIAGVQS